MNTSDNSEGHATALDRLTAVEREIHSYMDERRRRVPDFVQRRFSLDASVKAHRLHVKRDMPRMALNFVMTIPVQAVAKVLQWLGAMGLEWPGNLMRFLPGRIRTGFQREVQDDIRRQVFDFKNAPGGAEYQLISTLKLELQLPPVQHRLYAVLEATLDQEIGDFLVRRESVTNLAASGAAYGSSLLFLKQTIWGALAIGQTIAQWIAQKSAIKHFAFGKRLGTAFYHAFPAKPSRMDYIAGMAITGANDNDVWTYSAMSGWHPAPPSGGSGGAGDNLGNGYATDNVDIQGYVLTASSDAGPYRIGQTIQILGFGGGDGNGGAINIIGGDASSSFYTPDAITIRAGAGGPNGGDSAGAVLNAGRRKRWRWQRQPRRERRNRRRGTGWGADGIVVLHGNNSHGNGSGGVLLDLQSSDLKVQPDAMPTIYTGTTEDVHVWTNDGNGGLADITLHFVKGLYTGHTGP